MKWVGLMLYLKMELHKFIDELLNCALYICEFAWSLWSFDLDDSNPVTLKVVQSPRMFLVATPEKRV